MLLTFLRVVEKRSHSCGSTSVISFGNGTVLQFSKRLASSISGPVGTCWTKGLAGDESLT